MLELLEFFIMTPVGVVILAVVAYNIWKKFELKKHRKIYSVVMAGTTSIDEIAVIAQMEYNDVEKRLGKLIDLSNSTKVKERSQWSAFAGARIDFQGRKIVLAESAGSTTHTVTQSKHIVVCGGCGADHLITEGTVANCEYCGAHISKQEPQTLVSAPQIQQSSGPMTYMQQPLNINVTVNTPAQDSGPQTSGKRRSIALILCVLFGLLGGHLFYVGRAGKGVLYVFTFGLFFIGVVVDFFQILAGSFKDSFGTTLREW
jgi:hypothetical protein